MKSTRAVVVAILANAAIMATKYAAALVTGSSSMLSEAIHSTVDTCDSALLLVGQRRSRRPADEAHPFGHGQELYFWTLIVAVLMFGIGGGVSFYEGLLRLRHPEMPKSLAWSLGVLGAAAVFEGVSWFTARRAFNRNRRGRGVLRAFRESKDPDVLTVLAEDSAALVGIVLAATGVVLSFVTGNPAFDALGAMAVGLLLATVATLLARESKSLLLGESAGRDAVRRIRTTIEADPSVEKAGAVWTMHFGPDELLVTAELRFRESLGAEELASAVERLRREIVYVEPRARRIFLEPRPAAHAP